MAGVGGRGGERRAVRCCCRTGRSVVLWLSLAVWGVLWVRCWWGSRGCKGDVCRERLVWRVGGGGWWWSVGTAGVWFSVRRLV